MPLGAGSVSVVALEEGQDHHFEVQDEAPVLKIPEVGLDAVGEGGIPAQAHDLGPACHARLGVVAGVVMRDLMLEVGNELWALWTWPHERHLTFKDVPELGHFVDVPLTHELADLEAAGILCLAPLSAVFLGIQAHGADLDDVEGLSIGPGAALAVEDGTAGLPVDDAAKDSDERNGDHEADEATDDVDGTLYDDIEGAIEWQAANTENRRATHILKLEGMILKPIISRSQRFAMLMDWERGPLRSAKITMSAGFWLRMASRSRT